MKSIKLLATFLMLLFFAGTSFAQSLEVSGTVSDSETGETLPFAYVQIKGTTTGTQTDMDGRYTIETPANATLVYIFTGYVTQEVPVNSRSLIDVALDAEAVSLDDVLVVAYGTAKKESRACSGIRYRKERVLHGFCGGNQVGQAGEEDGCQCNQGA